MYICTQEDIQRQIHITHTHTYRPLWGDYSQSQLGLTYLLSFETPVPAVSTTSLYLSWSHVICVCTSYGEAKGMSKHWSSSGRDMMINDELLVSFEAG